ncbi:MAG: hypothetical protein Fur0028_07650 [Bacteroidales bacterium]
MSNVEPKIKVNICLGSSCFARGNKELVKELNEFFMRHHLLEYIDFKGTRCFGECKDGPFCKIDDKLMSFHSVNEVISFLIQNYPIFNKIDL